MLIQIIMKKRCSFLFSILLCSQYLLAQTTETFETETNNAVNFTDNGQVFNITSQAQGPFRIQGGFPGTGWSGTAADNKYIDNTGTAAANKPVQFTISAAGGAVFTLKSIWLYIANYNASLGVTGSCTVTGKLAGTTKYIATSSNGFNTSYSTGNGFTVINMTTYGGANNSATPIDEYVISTTGSIAYISLDAMQWQTASVLPVKWVSFNAGRINDNVELKWQTAEEINTSYYRVEYSNNGNVFNVLGNVAAGGKISNSYSFVHKATGKGMAFYRIVSVDKDGMAYYSGICKIAVDEHKSGFALLANPVQKGELKVRFNNNTEVTIANTNGQVLYRQKLSSGTSNINVSGFAKGIYLLHADGQTKKFVVE
jgi:hypothetical protein